MLGAIFVKQVAENSDIIMCDLLTSVQPQAYSACRVMKMGGQKWTMLQSNQPAHDGKTTQTRVGAPAQTRGGLKLTVTNKITSTWRISLGFNNPIIMKVAAILSWLYCLAVPCHVCHSCSNIAHEGQGLCLARCTGHAPIPYAG